MRRWEFVGDGSAKFWEAEVEGASVRVRYGRIGSEGRLQVKELGGPDAARTQLEKLVAEKERKGYAEVGAAAAPAPQAEAGATTAPAPQVVPEPEPVGLPELPDEDAFVMPAAWTKLVDPRRGRTVRAVTAPAPDALATAEQHITENREWIELALASRHSDPQLVCAARAYLAGEADALGAVAVTSLLPGGRVAGMDTALFTDAWVAQHGLVFAARAVVEAVEVEAAWSHAYPGRTDPRLRFVGPNGAFPLHLTGRPTDRVRELLSVTDQETYEDVVAVLATVRTTPRRRAVAAYLAPGTPGWADDCVADEPGYGDDARLLRPMLLRSLDDPGQVERLSPYSRNMWPNWSVALVATLADTVGTACVPLLGEAVDIVYGSDNVRAMTAAVAQFPTDDAFRILLARIDDKHARPALQEAMQRYPVRATRLLAEAARREGKNATAARQLLNTHVLLHRPQLPELLARLDSATAELVGSLDGARERVPDAAPESLPALLVSPPWTRKRTVRKPRVLAGLTADDAPQLAWRAGEQERWARTEMADWTYPDTTNWESEAKRVLGDDRSGLWYAGRLLIQGPADLLTPWLERWRPTDLYGGHDYLRPIVATYGLSALPAALSMARAKPGNYASLLLPYLAPAVAPVMADALVRLKSAQVVARSWFARH
ncbi:WGR domain-containing protein, partial [Kitasatospora sp. NPDC093558]|uniref:WGR domain-containing protein n=1 Tax=Kitasatospora sp. NPDC093558 TaxID=3155201 RepID=UPI00343DE7ED